MDDLQHCIQSLEAKLVNANVKKAKVAKNGMGNDKKKKKLRAAVALSTMNPKSKMPKSTKKKSATKLASPANKNNASNTASKKSKKKKPTTCKSDGKGQGKSTAACK
jgi:hypothetical protein